MTVFVSLFSLFIVIMYLSMAYSVEKIDRKLADNQLEKDEDIEKAKEKLKQIEDEHMGWIWIEDKKHKGNKFQRHFCLVMLIKDIAFAALLYVLYYKPLLLIIVLTILQVSFVICLKNHRPFNDQIANGQLIATQMMYVAMNLLFIVLVLLPGDYFRMRYYVVGFGLIACVFAIIVFNFYFMIKSAIKTVKTIYNTVKDKCCGEYKNKTEDPRD